MKFLILIPFMFFTSQKVKQNSQKDLDFITLMLICLHLWYPFKTHSVIPAGAMIAHSELDN